MTLLIQILLQDVVDGSGAFPTWFNMVLALGTIGGGIWGVLKQRENNKIKREDQERAREAVLEDQAREDRKSKYERSEQERKELTDRHDAEVKQLRDDAARSEKDLSERYDREKQIWIAKFDQQVGLISKLKDEITELRVQAGIAKIQIEYIEKYKLRQKD